MKMTNQYIYGIEVHVEGDIWLLRDDFYEEDEIELLNKNIKYSRKQLPNDKFRIVKFVRVKEGE